MNLSTSISTNPKDYEFRGVACKADAEGKKTWVWFGPAAVPLEVDTQGEATRADIVQQQCWDYCAKGDRTKVDANHDYLRKNIEIIEIYCAGPNDHRGFKEGSWIMGGRTSDPVIGAKVEKGEFNAWSWAGPVSRKAFLCLVSHPIEASGTTEKSEGGPFPEHDHPVEALKFDNSAKPLPGFTGYAYGHRHSLGESTRTGFEADHSHRLRIIGKP
jgi:hypothetical protein